MSSGRYPSVLADPLGFAGDRLGARQHLCTHNPGGHRLRGVRADGVKARPQQPAWGPLLSGQALCLSSPMGVFSKCTLWATEGGIREPWDLPVARGTFLRGHSDGSCPPGQGCILGSLTRWCGRPLCATAQLIPAATVPPREHTDLTASVDDPSEATPLPTWRLPHSCPWRKGSLGL